MFRISRIGRNFKLSTELVMVGFFLTVGIAIVESMLSVYLSDFYNLSKSSTGFIVAFFNFLSLVVAICSPKIISRFHEKKVLITSIVGILLFFVLAFFVNSLVLFLFLGSFAYVFQIIRLISFNILYRDNSKRCEVNKNEGFLYALLNVAWFVAPILGGLFLSIYSSNGIFLFASFFVLIGLLYYLMLDVKESHNKIKVDFNESIVSIILRFFSNRRYRRIYLISMWQPIISAFIFTFLPLMLLDYGFSKSQIGFCLAIMILPMVLGEFKADSIVKNLGYRRTFLLNFFVACLFFFFAFLFPNVYVKLGCVFIGYGIGFLVEPTREAYFFKKTSKQEEEMFYPIFATYFFSGLLLSRVVFSIFFSLGLNNNYAYLLVAILMSLIVFPIRKLKD